MLAFTQKDIARAIQSATLSRGRQVHGNGQVIDVDVNAGGTVFVGRVRGSEPKPYSQHVTLRSGKTGVTIHGTCSCPVHSNCKHVAAVLIEVQRMRAASGASRQGEGAVVVPAAVHAVRQQLPPALDGWLEGVEKSGNPDAGNDYPALIRQRLIYVLSVDAAEGDAAARASVSPMVANILKGGGFGTSPTPYLPSNIINYQPARHLRPIDFEILRGLAWISRSATGEDYNRITLTSDPMMPSLVSRMLASGRCRWGDVHGPELGDGPVRRAVPVWERMPQGRQRLCIKLAEDTDGSLDAVLPIAPPYYVDLKAGLAGPLDLGLPEALAARIAQAPEVPPARAAAFALALEQRLAAIGLAGRVPCPESRGDTLTRRVTPVPRLELFLGKARLKKYAIWHARFERHRGWFVVPLARLKFDYGGETVDIHAATQVVERFEGKQLVLMPRDHRTELAASERLRSLGLAGLTGTPLDVSPEHAKALFLAPPGKSNIYEFMEVFDDPARFMGFASETLPQLAQEGWQVTYSDDYPYRIAEGETTWWADIGEASGIDWLSFELGIEFEGHRLNLVPHLASMLEQLPSDVSRLAFSTEPGAATEFANVFRHLKLYHTLPDGRLLPLPGERLAPMLKAMLELIGPRPSSIDGGKVRLRRADAAAIASFADAAGSNVAWAASAERLITLGHDLKRGRRPEPVDPPASFKASLRPYQADGLAWLDFLRATGFGGVLADDMGLGKTVQTLAFLAREKAEGRLDRPALIIAPTSVLPNWQAETERFAPGLSVLALRGQDRHLLFGQIPKHDLVLTTYPLLLRDHEVLLAQEFHVAILDEAQSIKNPRATVTGLVHRIKARHRLALTGTPLENNLGEVWSLFEFVSPGLLGDQTAFRRTFRTPIEKHGDKAAQAFLSRRLKPFMLRRTKAEVVKELPPKTEIVERIRLEGAQRDLYETVRSVMHEKVRAEIEKKGLAKSHIVFLDALLKLRQVCCDPRLLKMPQARKVQETAKLERLMEMIPELVGEGRRILLFSQFTSMLALIEAELVALKIPYVMLTGDTADRATPVKAFQSGKVPLFLVSLKAGGTGLNLTAADTVIHYDPWWNPAVENQATDRAHRIGQTKPVFVYKLIVEDGIEEAIELLKTRKAALADALFAGAAKSGLDLNEADIAALFAPLGKPALRRAA